MRKTTVASVLLTIVLLPAWADKDIKPATAGDERVDLTASVYTTKEDAAQVIGTDPGMDLIVVQIRVRPRGDTKLKISRDDFLILSRRDGQRSGPTHPSQVAGDGVLVVSRSGGGGIGGGVVNQRRGPIWGGMPGSGDRPRRIGGDDDGVAASATEERVSTETKQASGDQTLLDVLKAKELREGETDTEVHGLLYFLLEGKHRAKDLELFYEGTGRKLVLDFLK